MSMVLVSLFLGKLWQFTASGMFSSRKNRLADDIVNQWEAGEQKKAVTLAATSADPQTTFLLHTTQHLYNRTLIGKALEDELSREAGQYLARLRSNLRSIELIAMLAPLIGLLGTVLGMIEAFQAMELAGKQVDPSTLSGGIWKALLTTAVGLIVAIPATVIHNWLERKIDDVARGLQDRATRLLTAVAMRKPAITAKSRTTETVRAHA
ncbi:unnamed protein product [Cyprideis torosa]|uniref:MotA/TolQ/ExbB proton channel domain-containing protein n=1 Tax=Cyprideis torosa TaxID=163714 RepID=A0A7R8WKA5_9CRUS|nr:unnamed protein product [Cyprideis torosa]CAG0901118.1 unnamed protein product [Cyprideis torosa]